MELENTVRRMVQRSKSVRIRYVYSICDINGLTVLKGDLQNKIRYEGYRVD